MSNDTDPDGDTLSTSLGAGPAHGSLTLNSDGSFTYTPASGFHGADGFTYTASDGIDSADTTATILVDAPPVAADDGYATDQETPLTVSAAEGVLVNDTDADGDGLSAVLVQGAAHGSLTRML